MESATGEDSRDLKLSIYCQTDAQHQYSFHMSMVFFGRRSTDEFKDGLLIFNNASLPAECRESSGFMLNWQA